MAIGDSIGNPALTPDKLANLDGAGRMTAAGTVRKFTFLLALLALSGGFVMHRAMEAFDAAGIDFTRIVSVQVGVDDEGDPITQNRYEERDASGRPTGNYGEIPPVDLSSVTPLMFIGLGAGFLLSMIIIFNPSSAPMLSPFYALAEGLALGGVSAMFEVQFGGIVMQALVLTFTIQLAMLFLYRRGYLKATGPFVTGLLSVMLGLLLLYFVDLGLQFYRESGVGILHSTGPMGIALSVGICIVAALNFIVDFDTIEQGVANGAPESAEWYAAFAMVLTFVWLYLEVLRLLAKMRKDSKTIWGFFRHGSSGVPQPSRAAAA